MIRKSLLLMGMFSFITYADGVVTLHKENGECKIIKKNKTKKDCSKKGSYLLEVDDTVKSSKVTREDFSYNQTKSALKPVFVVPIDEGYKIEKSFLTYLSSTYDNFMNPNKNGGEGGVDGYSNTRYKLPSTTKILYGDRLEIDIHKKDIKEIKECLLEDIEGNEIEEGYDCSKHQIILDSNKLNKDKRYKLFINNNKSIRLSFVDNQYIQSIQKKEQIKEFRDFKLYIYQINQKEEK